MRYLYCPNCGKKSGYKRNYGWGTFFAVVLSFGFWFLVMPFYPLRCIKCGNDRYLAVEPERISTPPDSPSLDDETKKCPYCAETIKLEARKCRFCGEKL